VSTLQCPATLLVVPSGLLDVDVLGLAERRVAWVWTDPGSLELADRVAARLGVGVTVREGVADREVLHEIADAHPGEIALVVSSAATGAVEVVIDADGWVSTPWGPTEPG
jgi:hypothetical protein